MTVCVHVHSMRVHKAKFNTHGHTPVHTNAHACKQTLTYACVHTHTHTHTHVHTHAHTNTTNMIPAMVVILECIVAAVCMCT